jgi:SAM-dependent methyltransferase
MENILHKIHYKNQNKHWWFTVKKKIILQLIRSHLQQSNGIKILDVGCGTGLMLNELSKFGTVYGLDSSEEAKEFCKEIFQGEVKIGSLPNKFPYEENSFDLIVALDVIEHISEDINTIKILYNALKHGGILIITVPANMKLWSQFDIINGHIKRYNINEIKDLMISTGFKLEKISYYNSILFPIAYLVRKFNNRHKSNVYKEIEVPNYFINVIFKYIFMIELYLLRKINFKFGVSILSVGKKI